MWKPLSVTIDAEIDYKSIITGLIEAFELNEEEVCNYIKVNISDFIKADVKISRDD